MKIKTIAAAFAIAFATVGGLAAMSGTADAKGGGGGGGHHGGGGSHHHSSSHHHHHDHFRHGYGVRYVVTPGCGTYLRRYEETGNAYWKRRYYECIG